ncbi:hypothetical protein IWQ55_002751 [Labrenzia sp. EL_208]|nr:hypothetical protein [Labrenzia sp. EL_132]MBG6229538.1 hypothetical protein [Labrenzia sp. EL_208]
MPIFKVNQKLVYFAHIPKCGGSALEAALRASDIEISFLDSQFWVRGKDRWCNSSPQHIPHSVRQLLFKDALFDYEFAVVRDPVERFLSAFNNNRKKIGGLVSFDAFLRKTEKRVSSHDDYWGARFDNHFLPSSRFVSGQANIFFLSNGLDAALSVIGQEFGVKLAKAKKENVQRYDKLTKSKSRFRSRLKSLIYSDSPRPGDLTDAQVQTLKHLYKEDYEKFSFQTKK